MINIEKMMSEENTNDKERKYERNTFIFLAVFLAPIISVAIVGALGLTIWISQMFLGPPGS